MFKKIFQQSYKMISFEDMQHVLQNTRKYIIINTLPTNEQSCLIKNTLNYQTEEKTINDLINLYNYTENTFIIYGRNVNDTSIEDKYSQIAGLGFMNVYLYRGGMFEWLLLQDIYGKDEFPTTTYVLDILKYKPLKIFE